MSELIIPGACSIHRRCELIGPETFHIDGTTYKVSLPVCRMLFNAGRIQCFVYALEGMLGLELICGRGIPSRFLRHVPAVFRNPHTSYYLASDLPSEIQMEFGGHSEPRSFTIGVCSPVTHAEQEEILQASVKRMQYVRDELPVKLEGAAIREGRRTLETCRRILRGETVFSGWELDDE